MPFVSGNDAFNRPIQDLEALARESGEAPWRLALVGTLGLRVVFLGWPAGYSTVPHLHPSAEEIFKVVSGRALFTICLLYTSDAADDLLCVDLGGRRIIKKKKKIQEV